MARGFLYLVAIMDWYSRYAVAWGLSNTLDVDFCLEAFEKALSKGKPEVFNVLMPMWTLARVSRPGPAGLLCACPDL